MDNWLFLFLGLILAYLLEFTRPAVKSYFEKSIFFSRKRRTEALLDEYKTIRMYKEDKALLALVALRSLAFGLITSVISMGGLVLSAMWGTGKANGELRISGIYAFAALVFMLGILLSIFMLFQSLIIPIRNSINFKNYKKKVMDKIIKLGGNPEDLDKEIIDEKAVAE